MEPQIIKLLDKEGNHNPLYNALKDPDQKHQRPQIPSHIHKDSDLIFFEPHTGDYLEEFYDTIGKLESAADRYIFFPDQQITDAEAKAIADRTGRKVLFNQLGAQCMLELKTKHFACKSATKDGKSVAFRCARPHSSAITNDEYIHEIPHLKNLDFDFNLGDDDWEQYIDIENESNTKIPQTRYELLATPTVERIPGISEQHTSPKQSWRTRQCRIS